MINEVKALDDDTSPAAWMQRAEDEYRAGHLEGALQAFEAAHDVALRAGDRVTAAHAAVNVALFILMDTGLMAPVRGWVTRSERLLEECDETPVHAWIAVVHTYERFMCGDMSAARSWAERAVALGSRLREPAAEAIGRLASGRVLILDGEVDEGLRLLDEAAVAVLSGDIDSLTIGIVYCELICAMQGLAQYDRAAEWTEAMDRWRGGRAFGGFNGRCRVHRAEILRLRGSDDAEDEALRACEELRPWMRREYGWPLTELGTIRLRKGDLAGAEEALLAADRNGWDPEPALALLRLAQGDVATATALIDDALDHPRAVPSKERPPNRALSRAPLLEARVEIALAAGDADTARGAADELATIATTFRSEGLRAAAALARGRVALAGGDAAAAVAACGDAFATWCDIGAPYEGAVARLWLGEARRALGNIERARLDLTSAAEAFDQLGASTLQAQALAARERAAASVAAVAPGASDAPAAGTTSCVFRLDGDIRTVVFAGEAVRLRDLKGMRYLAMLLGSPGRERHVLDLVAAVEGAAAVAGSRAGDAPLLDAKAKATLRKRLQDIEDDIDEAVALGDATRAALAEADRDYLVSELARSFGIGGRDRGFANDAERARASVTRAVRYALTRIGKHHRPLAEHLERTIQTGTYCCYSPDPRSPVDWVV